jgi:hypothetical protein
MIAHRNGEPIRNRVYRITPAFTTDFVAPLSSADAMNREPLNPVRQPGKQPALTVTAHTGIQPIHVSKS